MSALWGSARLGTAATALLVTCACALCIVTACTTTLRSVGEDCLKDEDCTSSICSQLKCAAAPIVLDGASEVPSGDASVSGADGDAAADAPVDTSPHAEAASDAPSGG